MQRQQPSRFIKIRKSTTNPSIPDKIVLYPCDTEEFKDLLLVEKERLEKVDEQCIEEIQKRMFCNVDKIKEYSFTNIDEKMNKIEMLLSSN